MEEKKQLGSYVLLKWYAQHQTDCINSGDESKKLTHWERYVLYFMVDLWNRKFCKTTLSLSYSEAARELDISDKTVAKAIKGLIDKGFVVLEKRGFQQVSSDYSFVAPPERYITDTCGQTPLTSEQTPLTSEQTPLPFLLHEPRELKLTSLEKNKNFSESFSSLIPRESVRRENICGAAAGGGGVGGGGGAGGGQRKTPFPNVEEYKEFMRSEWKRLMLKSNSNEYGWLVFPDEIIPSWIVDKDDCSRKLPVEQEKTLLNIFNFLMTEQGLPYSHHPTEKRIKWAFEHAPHLIEYRPYV